MKRINPSKIENKTFIIIILLIIILIISNPVISINSARSGLNLWFNILLPSLLPFFILSELLIQLKFIDIFGDLLQPLMKPLFNVSGQGAFPLILSVMSGYPVGIKLTSRLRQKNLISKLDGDRLIGFVSTSGPLFILGAVLVGMLNSPKLGPLLIYPHYLGSITLGLLFSKYKTSDKANSFPNNLGLKAKTSTDPSTSISTKPSIGLLISNSIRDSIDSVLLIGGFVIIYSVIIELLFTSKGFNSVLLTGSNYLHIDPELVKGLLAGIIELTTGCQRIASSDLSLIVKILASNFLIGWGGFSIHSQALSFISATDLNSKVYMISKIFHGLFSTFYTYIIYIIFYKNALIPSIAFNPPIIKNSFNSWIHIFINSSKISIGGIVFFMILALLVGESARKES